MKANLIKLLTLAGLALVALTATPSVEARDYYVEITNRTGYEIIYARVSPENSRVWEEDVLGSRTLSPGETIRVNLYGYHSPMFDIRLRDEEGDTYTFWDVNVACRDIVVTLAHLD